MVFKTSSKLLTLGRQLKPASTDLGTYTTLQLNNFNRIPCKSDLFSYKFRAIERSNDICDCKRFHTSKEPRSSFAKLSPQDVDTILRANEFTQDFPSGGSVKSYDSNQLASNSPMEDTRAEAKCLLTSGLLLGVFDGHGGAACAQVLSKRLFAYISAYLLPPAALNQYIASLSTETPLQLLEAYNDRVQFVDDVRDIYRASFKRYLDDIAKLDYGKAFEMRKALEESVLRLDADLADEALTRDLDGTLNLKTLSVAMTGAVACVAHIDGPQLHVAHVGDCNAVLGVRTDESNTWQANKLTVEHNTYNTEEYSRILAEHPHNESNTVLKMGRLLGQLAPLRALGDFRYKWSIGTMKDVVQAQFGEGAMPPNYYTPPYLTARPEVLHHRLTPKDKFLILATDGLWDIVSPLQVVRLVGEHMSGKVTLSPLKLPRRNMRLSDIHDSLQTRREGLRTKPRDRNASTHLIRSALGGTEYGIDHGKISQLLSLPEDVVRVFRDDITITVVYFDSEYLRHCPA